MDGVNLGEENAIYVCCFPFIHTRVSAINWLHRHQLMKGFFCFRVKPSHNHPCMLLLRLSSSCVLWSHSFHSDSPGSPTYLRVQAWKRRKPRVDQKMNIKIDSVMPPLGNGEYHTHFVYALLWDVPVQVSHDVSVYRSVFLPISLLFCCRGLSLCLFNHSFNQLLVCAPRGK